jgi:small subunit ribosomal protein S6
MPLPAPTYDLVMLLDPQAEENARAKLVTDARAAIESQGELVRHDDWGTRTLTYPIRRRTVAEYHLLQFHAGAPELLGSLDRSLRIADDVLRFRIIKLRPGVPDPPDMRAAPGAGARGEADRHGESAPPQADGPADGHPREQPAARPQAAPAPAAEQAAPRDASEAQPAAGEGS